MVIKYLLTPLVEAIFFNFPDVSMIGCPSSSFFTSISFQLAPLKPNPKAFNSASLAANFPA